MLFANSAVLEPMSCLSSDVVSSEVAAVVEINF